MSYLVLARKHRPQNFNDVIGQEHIANLLKKAIESDRVAHAYLFCGPRGVGKTSCARILAMCLNNEGGPTIAPDVNSPIAQEIAKGTSFDVLEIDGASNRGIDEIRTLRENAKFAPTHGRYKIYIVDEVHMLTTEAFNALLKTLEEPPEHVKFIFATTEPNKVPATIISRCQRFDFKRISIKTIVELLEGISQKENFKIDQDALYAIAKAAQGSLRDALSILDQLSALSDDGIVSEDVFSMLGLVETEFLFELTDALAQQNCSEALLIFEKILERGKDVKQLYKDIVEHFRNLMIIKIGGKSLGKLVDYPVSIKEMYLTQSESFSIQAILNAIDVFIQAQETARITGSARMPLEIAFAKLTYRAETLNAKSTQSNTSGLESKQSAQPKKSYKFSPVNALKNDKGQIDISGRREEPVSEVVHSDDNPPEPSEVSDVTDVSAEEGPLSDGGALDIQQIKRIWDSLTHAVSQQKMSVATYLQEGVPIEFNGKVLLVGFAQEHLFHKESLDTQDNKRLVEEVFIEKLQTEIVVDYKIIEEKTSLKEDSGVQSALETFEGKVVSRWHNELS